MTTTSTKKITADYTVSPGGLGRILEALVDVRQPVMVWGPPGVGKSDVAKQVAEADNRTYIDIRALLLDPVDLRGIPWRDENGRTRWATPDFLPDENGDGRYLINLEELPAAPPMVQAALYQLVLDRKIGEYELPEGASLIACGNRESDRGVSHKMPTPLASRFIHIEVTPNAGEWYAWAASNQVAPEVIFYLQMMPDQLHQFDPKSSEHAFPCPRTWKFVSDVVESQRDEDGNIVPDGLGLDLLRSIYRGAVGEGAATEFISFMSVYRDLPHPQVIISDPENAPVPENASALLALCGALTRLADDITIEPLVRYAERLRPEVGEFMIGQAGLRNPSVQYTRAWLRWTTAQQNGAL